MVVDFTFFDLYWQEKHNSFKKPADPFVLFFHWCMARHQFIYINEKNDNIISTNWNEKNDTYELLYSKYDCNHHVDIDLRADVLHIFIKRLSDLKDIKFFFKLKKYIDYDNFKNSSYKIAFKDHNELYQKIKLHLTNFKQKIPISQENSKEIGSKQTHFFNLNTLEESSSLNISLKSSSSLNISKKSDAAISSDIRLAFSKVESKQKTSTLKESKSVPKILKQTKLNIISTKKIKSTDTNSQYSEQLKQLSDNYKLIPLTIDVVDLKYLSLMNKIDPIEKNLKLTENILAELNLLNFDQVNYEKNCDVDSVLTNNFNSDENSKQSSEYNDDMPMSMCSDNSKTISSESNDSAVFVKTSGKRKIFYDSEIDDKDDDDFNLNKKRKNFVSLDDSQRRKSPSKSSLGNFSLDYTIDKNISLNSNKKLSIDVLEKYNLTESESSPTIEDVSFNDATTK